MLQTDSADASGREFSPEVGVLVWPKDERLFALLSPGVPGLPAQGRSVLAKPGDRLNPESLILRSGVSRGAGSDPWAVPAGGEPVVGALNYALGSAIEPSARGRTSHQRPASGEMLRVQEGFIHESGSWRSLGTADASVRDRLDLRAQDPRADEPRDRRAYTLGPMRSRQGRARYQRSVSRGVEYIRAGDVFQVNLAHELACPFRGDARTLFAHLVRSARPAYAAYLELHDRVILSLSPELFIHYDASTRRCVTRPMKGTAPACIGGLERSPKDLAELRMIVDLMRNDLARVCEVGSVRVERDREIERHAELLQGVATVSGTLRAECGIGDLVRAAFPAGSITGAPKVRAMQIIDEFEGFDRGIYCGSIALLDERGATMSVAIRTATIMGEQTSPGVFRAGELVYPVGAGIVADSTPENEWHETLAKASIWGALTRVVDA